MMIDGLGNVRFRENEHLNGGDAWFGCILRCVEHPRLSRFDKYMRRTRACESTWRVNGEDVEDLAAAVKALSTPPVVTDRERALLNKVPAEFVRWTDLGHSWLEFCPLRDKGLIVVDAGRIRKAAAA